MVKSLRGRLAQRSVCFRLLSIGLLTSTLNASQTAGATEPPVATIINGTNAQAGEFPFMAGLIRNVNLLGGAPIFDGFFCGATVISSRFVLTAAHCVEGVAAEDVSVVVKATNLAVPAQQVEVRQVQKITMHPEYISVYDAGGVRNDIALLLLKNPTTATPIALAGAADSALERPGINSLIAGWGIDETGFASSTLLKGAVINTTDAALTETYGDYVDVRTTIGAVKLASGPFANDAINICYGDSGGPLFVRTGSTFKQLGVSALVEAGCIPTGPGAFTRVSAYSTWLAPVFSDPNVTMPPTSTGAAQISGTAEIGQTVTCNVPPISGNVQRIIYEWFTSQSPNGEMSLLASGSNWAQFRIVSGVGSYLSCRISVDGLAGEFHSQSAAIGPIRSDLVPPGLTLQLRYCNRTACAVLVNVADNDFVLGVYGVLQKKIGRKFVPVNLVEQVPNQPVTTFLVQKPRSGTYNLWIRAFDASGNPSNILTVPIR